MNLSKKIKKYLLNVALKRPAPQRAPRSGLEGEALNCYVVRVFKDNDDALIIETSDGDKLDCLEFDGHQYSIKAGHNLESLLKYKFEFTHYYGLATILYPGWFDFAKGYTLKIPYIKAWLKFKRDDLFQFIYNRKKFITKQRIDLLKAILDAQLNGADRVSSISAMSFIYSERVFSHPNWEDYFHRTELYLNALADTHELARSNGDYTITGQGISAIERYEEEERKHSETMTNQRRMFWLTLTIAALTLVQAGLIKLPTIINLTK